MSLYHKYRPQTFEEMVGNASAIASLQKELEKGPKERNHSYMVTGPSGCGKTTLARMAARYLGADDLSIREVNTADNRGIDTAREIIEQTRYASPTGKPIVYIIDECHATSKDWQNAMLKILEDTPAHVYFFLCTTNPEKLLRAIHTRCFQVGVETLNAENLYRLVRRVAKAEGLALPKEILEEISQQAQGSPRASLNMLDSVSGMTDEEEMKQVIARGSQEEAQTIDLCRVLLKAKGWPEVAKVLVGLKEASADSETIRRSVAGYMCAILLKTDNRRAAAVLEEMNESTFASGFPGIVLMCYRSVCAE